MTAVTKFILKHPFAYVILSTLFTAILFTLIYSIIEPFRLLTHEGLNAFKIGLFAGIGGSVGTYLFIKKAEKYNHEKNK